MITKEQNDRARIMTESFMAWLPYLGIQSLDSETLTDIHTGMLFQTLYIHEQIAIREGLKKYSIKKCL